jgi:acyl-CoA thioesterase-2
VSGPAMQPIEMLVGVLDLERLEDNLFRGRSPDTTVQRVFGGQVAGQALVAAGRTVPVERPVHSLHAYFLRPGDPSVPIVYEVERTREGRTFSTRRVVAIQHGRTIFSLVASFAVPPVDGVDHQTPMPVGVPDPETLPTFLERLGKDHGPFRRLPRPIDLRYVEDPPLVAARAGNAAATRAPRSRVWFRADGELPDDPLLHVCALTYASDMTLLDAALLPHRLAFGDPGLLIASLDHAIWFHRPFRADRWLLYDQESPSAFGERGLAVGRIFTREGALVASVVQEGLIRQET